MSDWLTVVCTKDLKRGKAELTVGEGLTTAFKTSCASIMRRYGASFALDTRVPCMVDGMKLSTIPAEENLRYRTVNCKEIIIALLWTSHNDRMIA